MTSPRNRVVPLFWRCGWCAGETRGTLNPTRRKLADHWASVARERGVDAAALHAQARQLAALYVTGYVAEAYAKALASARGRPVLHTHNLIPLLEECGIHRSDLPLDLRVYAVQLGLASARGRQRGSFAPIAGPAVRSGAGAGTRMVSGIAVRAKPYPAQGAGGIVGRHQRPGDGLAGGGVRRTRPAVRRAAGDRPHAVPGR
ncbi:hypothetical protein FRAAL5167 [Frankia alni ACN14a]|uniref:HEPN domain-containing protein n=1 Tax=Frankia alni (strain DSM 45986 / CECT 9034 / ACN14a) TaxID=326424 RepID=Q0RFD8_FRAAA|nr:hypothetical protein FRAAL5167 [Frankia alni ACN14a]